MAISKKYFHDHLVLLLLSINGFLAVAGSLLILLRLGTSSGTGYIVQFRSSPTAGISDFKQGNLADLLSFAVFAGLVLVTHAILSHSAYRIHRQLAIFVLALGILLLVMMIIVSNALLVLR